MRRIVIYTTDNCPACFAAKRWFVSKGIPFEEVHGAKGERPYPTIVVDGRVFEGWSRQVQREIEKLLERGEEA